MSISLAGVADGQKLNLHLSGIVANDNTSVIAGSADIVLTVLEGNVTGEGVVNSSDASLESSSITNAAVTPANARFAINRDGSLTSADTALVSGRTSSVALSWTASANAASYSGYRTLFSGSATQFVQNLTTSYIDSPLTAGSAYWIIRIDAAQKALAQVNQPTTSAVTH